MSRGDIDSRIDLDVSSRRRWSNFRRHGLGYLGLALVLVVIALAVFGPIFISSDPNSQDLSAIRLPPFSEHDGKLHILGTDALGRDMFARVAVGAKASILVVLASLLIGGMIGTVVGMASGYLGGKSDQVLMRVVDAQLAIPNTIFAMLVAAVLGVGFANTALALGFASWPIYARMLRADTMQVKSRDFAQIARSIGASHRRMVFRHYIPNVISGLVIVATLEMGRMIIVESTLSFVGLGMQPPDASLGSMIRQGQAYLQSAWWLATIPGIVLVLFVLGLNTLGDWLRDLLDPRNET